MICSFALLLHCWLFSFAPAILGSSRRRCGMSSNLYEQALVSDQRKLLTKAGARKQATNTPAATAGFLAKKRLRRQGLGCFSRAFFPESAASAASNLSKRACSCKTSWSIGSLISRAVKTAANSPHRMFHTAAGAGGFFVVRAMPGKVVDLNITANFRGRPSIYHDSLFSGCPSVRCW